MQILVNGEQSEACSGTTIGAIVDGLELNRSTIAVELNQTLIPREQLDGCELHDGDRIEIVTLVGGG